MIQVIKFLKIFLVIIILTGCVQKEREQPVDKKEIIAITEAYNHAWELLDADSISEFHSDYIHYYWRGVIAASNKVEFDHLLKQLLPSMKEYKHTTIDPFIEVLGPDAAMTSFQFDGEIINPDGTLMDYDGALTYVFKRNDGEWKIVLVHESAPIPN